MPCGRQMRYSFFQFISTPPRFRRTCSRRLLKRRRSEGRALSQKRKKAPALAGAFLLDLAGADSTVLPVLDPHHGGLIFSPLPMMRIRRRYFKEACGRRCVLLFPKSGEFSTAAANDGWPARLPWMAGMSGNVRGLASNRRHKPSPRTLHFPMLIA